MGCLIQPGGPNVAHGLQVGESWHKLLTINLSRLQVPELINTIMEILYDNLFWTSSIVTVDFNSHCS